MTSKKFGQRLRRGLFWMSSGTLVKIAVQLVFMAILARLLTPHDYGLFAIIMLIVSISQLLTDFGIGAALVQRDELDEGTVVSAFYFNITIGFLASIFLYFYAYDVAMLFNERDLSEPLKAISIIFLSKSFSVVSESLLIRNMSFKQLALRITISYVFCYLLIALPLAYYGYGIWSLVYAQVVIEVSNACLLYFCSRHSVNISKFDLSSILGLFRYSSGIMLTGFINKLAINLDTFLVGRLLGMNSLGIYNRAYQIMAFPANTLGGVFTTVLFPALSSVISEKELKNRHFQIVTLLATLIMPLSVLLFITSDDITSLLLGSSWLDVVFILKSLSLALYFRVGYKVNGVLARAKGHVYKLALCQCTYVFYVFLACYFGHLWGLHGISIGMLLAIICQFITKTVLGLYISKLELYRFFLAHVPGLCGSGLMFIIYMIERIISFDSFDGIFKISYYISIFVFIIVFLVFIMSKINIYRFVISAITNRDYS